MGGEVGSEPVTSVPASVKPLRTIAAVITALGTIVAAVTFLVTNWEKLKAALGEDPPTVSPSPSPSTTASQTAIPSATCSGAEAMKNSNACYIAYQKGQVAQAEEICNRGLVEAKCAGATDVQGMLYFSLGLCAETRADWRSAKDLYESSLRVRSGNDKVQERLTAVIARLAVQAP